MTITVLSALLVVAFLFVDNSSVCCFLGDGDWPLPQCFSSDDAFPRLRRNLQLQVPGADNVGGWTEVRRWLCDILPDFTVCRVMRCQCLSLLCVCICLCRPVFPCLPVQVWEMLWWRLTRHDITVQFFFVFFLFIFRKKGRDAERQR